MDTDINALFRHIDTNQVKYIQRLSYAVAIMSVSVWPETRPDTRTMVEWTQQELEKLGVQTELREVGDQIFPDGTKLPLPPVLLGSLGNDTQKKTLLVYGHLDVQPAKKEDGWDTEPFVLTEVDGKLYGRGSTDDKGPVIAWINAIEAMQELKQEIPINIKFILEGMKESGSEGLDHLVVNLKDSFLKDVDFVSISVNYWLEKNKPCVTYGVRGISYFYVKIDGSTKDLDSGENGGTVYEAMTDVVAVLNSLVDVRGRIQIPGIYDTVAEVTEEERDSYGPIDFDLNDYRKDVGVNKLLYDNKTDILMHRWRYPSLSIHGIEGGVAEAGSDTVIPGKVIGKFSIRLVPDQHPDEVEQRVKEHIANVWKTHGSPNKIRET